ncbi:MAG: butyrate kinase [candidate division KSB1 bacterium]|nr:butyrate kinase [candidate division KSB1 bacterium]MDZ7302612.1 butyrate kinase [candidate division KSB1 bacterium]MDZ7311548.1 butyrate kinase [candidate division KSB1 bacterium]
MAETAYQILVINPGSTSTKLALYANEVPSFTETLRHPDSELAPFVKLPIIAQLELRLAKVLEILRTQNIDRKHVDAVVGRGGLLKPLASGTYRVNERMLDDLRRAERGDHASNLGAFIAQRLAAQAACPAFIVDPVSVDEWPPVARLSGLADLDRECLSHALNTKAIAKRFAREHSKAYEEMRLIVAHLGSGISISAHENGKMIDVTNSREEGAFSTERAGTLPVMKLVDLCFSGKFSRHELETKIFREGGIFSYLGTKDLDEVLRRMHAGDEQARLVFAGMIYQISKEIGAMAAVLSGRAQAILLTGGMVHAPEVVAALRERIGWIAPTYCYPGEDEMQALAEGALRVLRGEEQALEYL